MEFVTTILKPSLRNYSDAYILLDKEILAITGVPAIATDANK